MNNDWIDEINKHELEHGADQIAQGVALFKKGEYRMALDMFDQGLGRVSCQANRMREHIPVQKFSPAAEEKLFGHLKKPRDEDDND